VAVAAPAILADVARHCIHVARRVARRRYAAAACMGAGTLLAL